MAHAPLLRMNTGPAATMDVFDRLNSSMSAASAPRVSQLSGSSTFPATNSTTSLTSLSSSTTFANSTNGTVTATNNIINQKADASRSLYQICVGLKQRLALVPGFEGYMEQLMSADALESGPVESLWQLLRTGHPLLVVYNALQPETRLQVEQLPGASQAKLSKIAILRFVEACKSKLNVPATDCFIITDLTGDDTTGFVKVTAVINYVLDLLEERGLLLDVQPYPEDDALQPGLQMSHRDYVVREMVDTERKYVQDLENLQDLKKTLEERGIIPGDVVHDIFLNINAILDCQRKFLIRVETTNSQPAARQEWGAPFVANEDAFNTCYQPFIANQKKAGRLASQVFDKIQTAQHAVACDLNTLDGFLLKPMQRLVKYPLLLKELLKKCEDEATKADLTAGIEAASRVLQKANEAVDRAVLDEALEDLKSRVDDWKNHQVDQFGRLLLHGNHTVIPGKSDQEKEYEIYLFESILLCCKELVPGKTKEKKDKTKSAAPKPRSKNAKLQLKGRIFMTNVTNVVTIAKPGSYGVQILWKGDPGVESFIIKFQNEEMMKKWATGLEQQRQDKAVLAQTTSPDRPVQNFTWIASQAEQLENPFTQNEEDDDDATVVGATTGTPLYTTPMPGTMPRNVSSASLRQRSATSDSSQSLAGIARAPPGSFPMPQSSGGLSVQTQVPIQPSPLRGPADSYFSPVAESPASSRTSTTSGIFSNNGFPFPKAGTPQPGWGPDDSNRYTAPAMPRAPSRDGPSPVNAFGMVSTNGRNPRGPSMPVMPRERDSTHAAQLQQQRSRSYSTPDINGQAARSGQSIPAVPGIPAHLSQNHPPHPIHVRHDSNIPRSNTGSPANDLPLRTNTSSPGAQRTRQYGGMAQFPTQPVYPRQGTPGSAANLPPPAGPPPTGLAPLAPIDPTRTVTPGLVTAPIHSSQSMVPPTPDAAFSNQLRVRVNYDVGNYFTLVVQFDKLTYQSLISRIDLKLGKHTHKTIAKGDLKLRYEDDDGDLVTINSDDDIQIAISEWHEGMRNSGSINEIELFCVGDLN
ncbi:putative guanine nucleotide exchange factor for Rho/Rac/Cdc42-like GTPase [Podospora australis]|uniref:Guanine nucleotide exchange factor for Rho/Rac/Cdc42-like GTPase n=1 Tax=Podospora australis TaxID=1536484 RepID=A0AAN7AJD7_9PEZI|nr:putative guanine nucleotide exchange factor for Rho/Rac/Cdc42-like GTPase [Podospora australis]